MSYSINLIKEHKCVSLTYEGDMSPVEIMAARYEATGQLAVKRWNKVVMNLTRLQCNLTTLELIDLASELSLDLPRSARVALVVRLEQASQAKLVERVARTEGVLLAYFFDVEQATAWVNGTKFHGRASPELTNNPVRKE